MSSLCPSKMETKLAENPPVCAKQKRNERKMNSKTETKRTKTKDTNEKRKEKLENSRKQEGFPTRLSSIFEGQRELTEIQKTFYSLSMSIRVRCNTEK